ncbi:hypothetical protein IV102_22085 [bacterium]|nr:hypothetical protein [bacterium]
MSEAEQVDPVVQQLRQELEEQRHENERLKSARSSWLDRHLAVMVTAMVSLATLSFSAAQWRVAQLNEQSAKAERARMEAQEEQRRTEEWAFKGLEFIFSHESYFFGDSPRNYQKAVRILAVGFPERVSKPFLKRLEMVASPQEMLELKTVQAQMHGEAPPPRPPQPGPQTPPPPRPGLKPRPVLDGPIGQDPPRPRQDWRPDPVVERPRPLDERRPLRNRGR